MKQVIGVRKLGIGKCVGGSLISKYKSKSHNYCASLLLNISEIIFVSLIFLRTNVNFVGLSYIGSR